MRYPFIDDATSDEFLSLTLLFVWDSELLWEPSLPNPPPQAHRPFSQLLIFSPNTGLRFGESPLHGRLKCPFGTWEVTPKGSSGTGAPPTTTFRVTVDPHSRPFSASPW